MYRREREWDEQNLITEQRGLEHAKPEGHARTMDSIKRLALCGAAVIAASIAPAAGQAKVPRSRRLAHTQRPSSSQTSSLRISDLWFPKTNTSPLNWLRTHSLYTQPCSPSKSLPESATPSIRYTAGHSLT